MQKQTFSGRVREQLSEIERKLEAGFSQQSILEELALLGFKTTLKTFRSTIYRARQRATRRGKAELLNVPPPMTAVAEPVKPMQMGPAPSRVPATANQNVRAAPGSFNPPKIVDMDEFKVDELAPAWNPLTRPPKK